MALSTALHGHKCCFVGLQVEALDLLPLFFRLFRCQDKALRRLLFRHIIAGTP